MSIICDYSTGRQLICLNLINWTDIQVLVLDNKKYMENKLKIYGDFLVAVKKELQEKCQQGNFFLKVFLKSLEKFWR